MLLDTLSEFCIRHEIVQKKDLPMLRYCIEKRFYTIINLFPLFFIGIMLANLTSTVPFLISFSYLRSMTNGLHAKKPGICFLYSLLIEFVLFKYIIPLISFAYVIIFLIASILVVFSLAPFNHPCMSLTPDEVEACRVASRHRLLHLLFVLFSSTVLSWTGISIGLCLGIALASVLLCLAYIFN